MKPADIIRKRRERFRAMGTKALVAREVENSTGRQFQAQPTTSQDGRG